MANIANIPAAAVTALAKAGATILDVRTPGEHAAQRLEARHTLVPLDRLDPADFMLKRGLDKEAPVYILCRSGMRARTAAEKFAAAGYNNAAVIEGGILACAAGGVAVIASESAPQVMSLERQVRIAAGALVAAGTLLGFYAGRGFYLLPFFVGLGLVYAGMTDRCGMALLLLKMPWNKGAAASCGAKPPETPDAPTAGGCA